MASQKIRRKDMKHFEEITSIANQIATTLTMILSITLVGVVFFQVINRFILHIPAPWTEEIDRYVFVWVSFVGAAKALRDNAHVGTQVLISKLSRRIGIIVAITAEALSLYFHIYIMFYMGTI